MSRWQSRQYKQPLTSFTSHRTHVFMMGPLSINFLVLLCLSTLGIVLDALRYQGTDGKRKPFSRFLSFFCLVLGGFYVICGVRLFMGW